MIKAINHITINLKDKEKSFWFYGEVLGLKKLNAIDMGEEMIYYFQLPAGCRLELIESLTETPTETYKGIKKGTYRHFAVEVDDIHALKETFDANEITVKDGPTPSEKLGVYYMLIEDPNGVEVEFVQPLD